MSIVSIILTILKLAELLTQYAKDRQLLTAGHDQAIAEASTNVLNKVRRAEDAAERVLHPRDSDDVAHAAELQKRFERPG